MSSARWNLKEAGGKVPAGVTRTSSGMSRRTSLQHKTTSHKLHGCDSVNDAGIWNEGDASYRGRSPGRVETVYEARLKQDLSGEVSRDHSTEAVDGLGKG